MKKITVNNSLSELIVVGESVWSEISEAKPYKDPKTGKEDNKKNFSVSIIVGEVGDEKLSEEVTRQVDAIEDKMFQEATSDLSVAKKKTAQRAGPKYRYEEDAAGETTGRLKMSFKRKEALGAPQIFGPDGTEFKGKFIPRGSTIAVRATVRSYKGVDDFGATYQLEQIKILELADSVIMPKKLDPDLDKEFGVVNLDELPL